MKKKILVVDDYPVILKYMKRLLEKEGHEVRTATDGLCAIDILETFIPEVVFIDLVMPNIGGQKLCRVIREMPQMRDACIVILSAIAAEDDFDFTAIGANACIAKGPFETMSKHILTVVDQSDHILSSNVATEVMGLKNLYKRKITAELLATKKHFEAVLDHMSEGIIELTPAGKVVMANPAAAAIMNDSEERLLGLTFTELFDYADQKEIEGYIEVAPATRPTDLGEFTVEFNKRKIFLTILPVEGEEDRSFLVILLDVTEAKQAQDALQKAHKELEQRIKERTAELVVSNEKLKIEIQERAKAEAAWRESEEKYRELVENINEVIYSVDEKGMVNYISPAVTALFGYETEEMLGRNFSAFFPEGEQERIAKDFEKIASGKLIADEYRVLTQSGDLRWVRFSSRPVVKGDLLLGVRGVMTDITKSKQLEDQLQQAQKMESIGTLAGGIAHDFNNILSAIIGYTEISMSDLERGSLLYNNSQKVLKAGERARDLVSQILAFSRQSELEPKPVQITLIAKETLKLLRATLPTTIEIHQSFKSNSAVMADPTQIHQVIMNLCTNAGNAMQEKGGSLDVKLVDVDLDSEFTDRHPDINLGAHVKLTVSDTGHGMSQDIMNRIFDPFFTTKEKGEGTGMGLSVVHGIINSHGGTIAVESELGKGSKFEVIFPAIESDVAVEPESAVPLAVGTEQILFVDDEEFQVDVGKQILEHLGYSVVTRTSSLEALELFRARPNDFDLVITDMTMPKMTGKDLAKELMSIRSDIPIILCTGFSEQIDEKKAMQMGIRTYVMKPIVMSQIANTIREVLDKK